MALPAHTRIHTQRKPSKMLLWAKKKKSVDLQGVINPKDDPFSTQLRAKFLLPQFELFSMWCSCDSCTDRWSRAYSYLHICVCALGDLCEEVVDPCLPGFDPCQHDSKCVPLTKGYRWVCHLQGWKVRVQGGAQELWAIHGLSLVQYMQCVCVVGVSVCQATWGSTVSRTTTTVWRTSVSMGLSVWTPLTVTHVCARMVSGKTHGTYLHTHKHTRVQT